MSESTTLTHRDHLAFLLYCGSCKQKDEIPCRWGVLRDDLKLEWLAKTDSLLQQWIETEEWLEGQRLNNPRAFFC